MHELFKNIVNNIEHFLKNTSGTNKFCYFVSIVKNITKKSKKRRSLIVKNDNLPLNQGNVTSTFLLQPPEL